MTRLRASLVTGLLGLLCSLPLPAQERFGEAVAVAGSDVLVLKPGGGRGLPAVYVFRAGEGEDGARGTWSRVQRLGPAGAEGSGEGFSSILRAAGDVVIAAGGDGAGRWGAHVYERRERPGDLAAEGRPWEAAAGVPVREEAGAPSGGVDLAAVMAILQPSRRVVALSGDASLLAVTEPGEGPVPIRLFRREGPDAMRWTPAATVTPDSADRNGDLGTSVAVDDGTLLVGAPGRDGGTVVVFRRDGRSGAWTRRTVLRPVDLPANARFGLALSLADDTLWVGAPGAETVLEFVRTPDGEWREETRLRADTGAGRRGFGGAIARTADELWVGAPLADEGRGAVHRFVRSDDGAGWVPDGVLAPERLDPGSFFGAAVDVGPEVAVVGAHGVRAGEGRAVVYARRDTRDGRGEWRREAWLEADDALPPITGEEVPCADDVAAGFACRDVDLLAFLSLEALGAEPGERVSDIWGWTDPRTEREYALVGRTAGMLVVDVTEPASPGIVGLVPANPSGARDIKVYRDHAFFTGDGAGDHGLVVFDLTRIREVEVVAAGMATGVAPATLPPDTVYREIASAHNLVLDTGSGFAFPVGASGGGNTCGGGLHMVDVRDPLRPAFAGCYTDTHGLIWQGRTHDAQCVVYRGPDADYQGREICFASNETALRIVDVTDKEKPVPVSAASHPGRAYIHQGWLTDDQRHFYMNDELDELVGLTPGTRTLVWDVSDLDDPIFVGDHVSREPATDHNLYVKGDRMYQANYHAGLRVLDIGDRTDPVEIGFFDTTPYGANPPGFAGAWTAYPFFESGTVIVSSMNEGLFILRPERRLVP